MYAQTFQLGRLLASVLGATAVILASPLSHAALVPAHAPDDALASLTRVERNRQLGRPSLHATVRAPLSPRAGRLLPTALWPDQELILSASRENGIGLPVT